jgi:hypothetical protein
MWSSDEVASITASLVVSLGKNCPPREEMQLLFVLPRTCCKRVYPMVSLTPQSRTFVAAAMPTPIDMSKRKDEQGPQTRNEPSIPPIPMLLLSLRRSWCRIQNSTVFQHFRFQILPRVNNEQHLILSLHHGVLHIHSNGNERKDNKQTSNGVQQQPREQGRILE